ncbi:MAG TPA: heavy metal translocating P-type ATPase [Candidatus Dormibacteraeota bacterium]|nr:heavy metal translocating P-type ATPase [Candidatus Dormibacteraeota bacterium]
MRIRLDRADARRGQEVAAALRAHRRVRSVRWTAAARSLTVHFEVGRRFEAIVDGLRAAMTPPPATDRQARPLWREFLAPAAALLAGLAGQGPAAAAVIAACGLPILRRAWRSLRRRQLTIDVLDVTAVGLLIGTGGLLAAGVSVALIEASDRLRERAAGRARHSIRSLMGLSAGGIRVRRNGSEPRVPAESVIVGDEVVVYPGESVPVDGVVVTGSGSVDTSSWTGEPLPRRVESGVAVLTGSALVDGRIVVDVTATGDDTRAARLAAAMEAALAGETRVSDLALRIADRFVLPVLAGSGLAFLTTRQLERVIAMLIFDLGTGIRVSVPTTVLTTMVVGARQGVLFKSGQAIEELARADVVVFDKTGTLTSSDVSVHGIVPADSVHPDAVLRLAAAAEGHLAHPIARAIRGMARRRALRIVEPERLRYHRGGGVEAVVDGRLVLIGDLRLLWDHGVVDAPERPPDHLAVHMALDGMYAARIRLEDTVRAGAAGTIQQLRRMGMKRIWLASGDRRAAAAAVSRRLGLDGYDAQLMPEDKVAIVARMRAEGRRVVVVGDGINDAPAMAEADASVALPRGADLTREAADIVLLNEDLDGLLTALRLARTAMTIIRQNVALVAVPNAFGMLLATLGLLGPLAAAVLNNGSALLAALNGLRPLMGTTPAPSGAGHMHQSMA